MILPLSYEISMINPDIFRRLYCSFAKVPSIDGQVSLKLQAFRHWLASQLRGPFSFAERDDHSCPLMI